MKKDLPPWLAYLTPVGWLIAWIQYKRSGIRSSLVLLHLRQMMGLVILLALLWILQAVYIYSERIQYLTIPGYFLLFILWLKGFSDALMNKEKPIPLVGKPLQQVCMFLRQNESEY